MPHGFLPLAITFVTTLFLAVHCLVPLRRSDFLPVTGRFLCCDRNKLPTFKFIKIVILPFYAAVAIICFQRPLYLIYMYFFFSFYVLLLSLLLRLSLVDVTTHFVSILILTLFRFKDFCCAIFYARAFPFQFFMPLHSLPAQGLGHCPRQTLHSIRVYVCICVCVCADVGINLWQFIAIHFAPIIIILVVFLCFS